jgi:DNA-directed RNA polymerase subunit H (RpoH/RPB5)
VFAARVGTGMRLERAPSKHVLVICDRPSKSVSSKSAFPATPPYLIPTPTLDDEKGADTEWPREGLTMQTPGVKVECLDTGIVDLWQNEIFAGCTLEVTNDVKGIQSTYMLADIGHSPRRVATDPLMQYFGIEAGSVLKLTMPSSTAGYTTEPRFIVEQEGPAAVRKAVSKQVQTLKRTFVARRPI